MIGLTLATLSASRLVISRWLKPPKPEDDTT